MFLTKGFAFGLCHVCCNTFADSEEISLHFSRRLKEHKHTCFSLAHFGEGVGNTTRTEHAIARFGAKSLVAHPKQKLALKDIPPLILLVMNMQWRASLFQAGRFENKDVAVCIPGRNFGIECITLKKTNAFARAI